jgi:SagB-type dehydrogenase family enzyme
MAATRATTQPPAFIFVEEAERLTASERYHRATKHTPQTIAVHPRPDLATRPRMFRDNGAAERLPVDCSVAGRLLQAGAGIVRSQSGRDYGGGTMHWRAYSSAGGLFPVDAYIAGPDGLYSFDVLSRTLARIGRGDARSPVADALSVQADIAAFIILTGITARTGWKYGERGYRHVWWDAGTMLANLLALAAAEELTPRLYTAFVDQELNALLGVDGTAEMALAVLALGSATSAEGSMHPLSSESVSMGQRAMRFPLAEAAHAAGMLPHAAAVDVWRREVEGEEPRLDRDRVARAIRRRSSVRNYAATPLPHGELADLLAWSEAAIPADAQRVVRQAVSVAAVEGLLPGIYTTSLKAERLLPELQVREGIGLSGMEQGHVRGGAVNVIQLARPEAVLDALGDRGYRWAHLEAGIRAGRLQVGAFDRGWGAAASTFYDDELSDFLGTTEAPMLMVAIGRRR